MIFSNACLIVASMAMIPTAFSQNQGAPGSIIGGVTLKTDVTAELVKDLVFKKLTDEIGSESCADLAKGKTVYDDNPWLSSMPTYKSAGTELKLYEKYYGANFLNKWVNAAFSGQNVQIENWEADFTKFKGEGADAGKLCVGREEAIKKVIGYTSTYIELNQYMQQAVQEVQGGCIWSKDLYVDGQKNSNPCKDAVNAWEKAIATWSGSIEGEYGRNLREPGETGKFLEALAEKRCVNFKTCGVSSKDSTNKGVTPRANMGITASFEKGRAAIFYGKIGEAKRIISEINKDLTISRIQGVMRYAYRMGQGSKKDKEIAEGAAFALGVLPQIYACNKKSAEIIAQNMQIGGDFSTQSNGKSVNFANVRAAFECNYPCLGIRFSDVGSLNDCVGDDGNKTNCFTAKKDKGNICQSPFSKKFKTKCKRVAPNNLKNKTFAKTRFGKVSLKQY
jgi:hypothetical protein